MNKFMKIALSEALKGVESNGGGPFGAVIVQNGKIISRAHNEVVKTNDPTAHAEILAIRRASLKLRNFNLSDCDIYSTCEPCPMCFSAIMWAKIKKIYCGCGQSDATAIGFDDRLIRDVIMGSRRKKTPKIIRINRKNCMKAFQKWFLKKDRVNY